MSTNLLLVGFGSMGRRRARLLAEIDPNISITVLDSSEERRQQAAEMGFTLCDSLDDAVNSKIFDAGIICSAPLSHPSITKKLLQGGISVFSELNLTAEGYPEMLELAGATGAVWFNSNTMLYRNRACLANRCIWRRKGYNHTKKTHVEP